MPLFIVEVTYPPCVCKKARKSNGEGRSGYNF